ncbi:carbon-nitrogen hydrolase [Rhypophila decipiens]|uniref:Carbon-nitrogen hydrolase n=1 Tax=Rhypophila decipiens TaxID=261697 RepID=A0AAN6YCP4_9PEZI|nr:carbon-nitrogen hydrolase [Rhypophila decipiens]
MAPPPTTKKVRLGTASPATQATTPETLAHLEQIARQATDQHIDILLLPEAFIGGYPRGTHFGCVIGARSDEGRNEYLRYFQSAVDLGDVVGDGGAGGGEAWVRRELPGDARDKAELSANGDGAAAADENPKPNRGDGTREELERIAKQTGVFLVVGCIEKAGGSMYCSAVYVCPSRGMVGKRRKVMPTGTERLVWAQGSPATLQAVSTTIRGVRINMAAAICWENYMPLLRQSLYSQNVNLYLAPTADGRDTWLSLLRTIGIEGRCFVVSSNMCVKHVDSHAPPPAVHAPVFEDDKHLAREPSQGGDIHHQQPSRRRTSCVTEEGFEIALPPSPTQTRHHTGSSRASTTRSKRRKSVFDEDGNEIVLCCKDDDDEDEKEDQDTAPVSPMTTSSNTTTTTAARLAALAKSHVPHPKPKPLGLKTTNGTTAAAARTKFVSRGGSCIVSPFGDVLAGPQWEDDKGILYVDVDFEDCIRGRLDFDAGGSYSRNDSFKFSVQGLDLNPLPY